MQFLININQEKLASTNLDLIEAAILEYLYHYCSSVSPKIEKQRLIDDLGVWTWIDLKQLAKDMPLLRINNSTALSRRIPKIKEAGFIQFKHGAGKKLYIKLTPKCDTLYRKNEPEMITNISEMTNIITESKNSEPEMTKIISRNDENESSIYNSNTNNTYPPNPPLKGEDGVKKDFRNPDIQKAMDALQDIKGSKPLRVEKNRWSLKRLIKTHGVERVIKALTFSYKIREEDRFAPRIYDYIDLEYKWDPLVDYAKSSKKPGEVKSPFSSYKML